MSFVFRVVDCATFRKTSERFGGLSNMASGFPLLVNGVSIRTSEALYQAMRFPHLPDLQAKIIRQASPMAAKMVTKPYRDNDSRPDWMVIRVSVMNWAIRVKLAQNFVSFGDLLLSTGSRPIVEESLRDDYWGAKPFGVGQLRGQNVLGTLLGLLRTDLLNEPETLIRVTPPPVGLMLFRQPVGVIEKPETDDDQSFGQKLLDRKGRVPPKSFGDA